MAIVNTAALEHALQQPVIGLDQTSWKRLDGDRKFEGAEPDHPEANLAMGWIAELYAVDERAGDNVELRRELRRTESVPVLAKLKTWLWSQAALKTLSIGKAAGYAVANWDRLTRFVANPLVPLDNNDTERGHPRTGRRQEEPLRIEVEARHRGRGALLHAARDRQVARRRPRAVPARGGAGRGPR